MQFLDRKTVTITLPNQNSTKFIVNHSTTIAQVINILLKTLPEPPDEGEEYGITIHESPHIIFDSLTKIAKIPTVSSN